VIGCEVLVPARPEKPNICAFESSGLLPAVERSLRAYDWCVVDQSAADFRPRPIRTASAAQQIADQIRAGILSGGLVPGDRLPSEVELAEEYGVSRGTVRETMKILAAAQLVQPARGAAGGTFVRHPDPDVLAATMGETLALWFSTGSTTLAEVDTARAWIEEGCVRLACDVRTPEDADAIRRAVEAMEPPPAALDDILAIDLDFHIAVSRAAHNAVLELAMKSIHLVRPHTNTVLMELLDYDRIAAQHRAIFAGIEARDATAAVDALRTHLAYLEEARDRALAERAAFDLPLAALGTEAHPAIERARARILQGDG
jgi:GntR family transcriptional regulator, transcriptional repressor for pyruvate dehydrogenase complex